MAPHAERAGSAVLTAQAMPPEANSAMMAAGHDLSLKRINSPLQGTESLIHLQATERKTRPQVRGRCRLAARSRRHWSGVSSGLGRAPGAHRPGRFADPHPE